MRELVSGLILFVFTVPVGATTGGVATGLRTYLEGLDAGDAPMTALVADDGEGKFRRDIYDRDRVLIEALRAQASWD